jgi:hypothetical protein
MRRSPLCRAPTRFFRNQRSIYPAGTGKAVTSGAQK